MPDIFDLLGRWWKQILLIVALSVAVVAVIVFTQPVRYMSMTTALPANPALADKASIYNANVQAISSSIGSADELDAIVGTAQLDTAYIAISNSFNLWDHYKTEGNDEEKRYKAVDILKKNTRVIKSDFGELKVKVWDSDKHLAPQLADAIMQELNAIHQSVQNQSNEAVLTSLKNSRDLIAKEIDSVAAIKLSGFISPEDGQMRLPRQKALMDQLEQNEKLIGQYQLVTASKPAVVVIVERARVSDKPDRPQPWLILFATAFLAFLFGLLLSLVLERRKAKA